MYDKKEFVDGVVERDVGRLEIIKEARDEVRQTERESHRVPGAPAARAAGSGGYGQFLLSLVFFLGHRIRPASLSDDDFDLLLPLAEHLVARGDLQASVLELFRGSAKAE